MPCVLKDGGTCSRKERPSHRVKINGKKTCPQVRRPLTSRDPKQVLSPSCVRQPLAGRKVPDTNSPYRRGTAVLPKGHSGDAEGRACRPLSASRSWIPRGRLEAVEKTARQSVQARECGAGSCRPAPPLAGAAASRPSFPPPAQIKAPCEGLGNSCLVM